MKSTTPVQVDYKLLPKTLWKSKWIFLSCILGVLIPIFFYNQSATSIYETTTSIIYERFNSAMTENSTYRPIDKNIINNMLEEIKSNAFIEEVVKSLPEDIRNSYQLPAHRPPDFNIITYLAKTIRNNIAATNITNSDVIEIKTKAASPIIAKELAKTVTDVLKQRNLKIRQETISNVRKMIEEQLVIYAERLKQSEDALRDYKEKDKITYLDQESSEILKRITEAEIFYNKALANRESSENRYKFIKNKLLNEQKELVPLVTETGSPMIRRLKDELINLEVEYTKLKVQNYPENHPKMLELNSQINLTKQRLTDETMKLVQGANLVDPLSQIQQLMEEIIQLEIEIETYRAQEKASQQILKDYDRELQRVPEKELVLLRLIRERDVNEKLYVLLMEKREEARINEAENLGNIRELDPPHLAEKPIWPKKSLNILLGIILGIILSLALIAALEVFNKRLHTPTQIAKVLDLTVLGNIPRLRFNAKKSRKLMSSFSDSTTDNTIDDKLISNFNTLSLENEAFRKLRTNLQFLGLGTSIRTLLITSSVPAEGKSLIAANLAISISQLGFKVLLVDTDFRKPSLHNYFNQDNNKGLVDLLRTSQKILTTDIPGDLVMSSKLPDSQNDSTRSEKQHKKYDSISELLKKDKIIINLLNGHLDLITSGHVEQDSAEMIVIPFLNHLMEAFRSKYDIIVFDSPPANIFADASLISSLVDMVLLVVKTGINTEIDLQNTKEVFKHSQARKLGLVINFAEENHNYSKYY